MVAEDFAIDIECVHVETWTGTKFENLHLNVCW